MDEWVHSAFCSIVLSWYNDSQLLGDCFGRTSVPAEGIIIVDSDMPSSRGCHRGIMIHTISLGTSDMYFPGSPLLFTTEVGVHVQVGNDSTVIITLAKPSPLFLDTK